MAFTDRYIKLTGRIVNIKEADMVGDENAVQHDIDIYFNPMDISTFRPGMDDEVEQGNTIVEFKSGHGCAIVMPVEKFIKTVNDFMK